MIFAQISQKFQPLRFMACALLVWCVACVASGFGFEFYSLSAARCLTGVGEAAFIILAPPYIDIAAPTEKRSMWLSIFYIAIPLGYALGFVIGGKFLHANPLGDHWTWRVIFIFESS
jgi:MFS family permease